MPVIMFWNVRRSTATPYLAAACLENNVDILIVAEEETDRSSIEHALSSSGGGAYAEYAPVESKLRFFTRFPLSYLSLAGDSGGRLSVRILDEPGKPPISIAAVHVPSKMHRDAEDQFAIVRGYRRFIEKIEENVGHKNTMIIGDMNMNPFEPGMSAHDGFHGVMTKDIANEMSRVFASEEASFFYNPMWSRMGDESLGPPGSYFYKSSGTVDYMWHYFDQALLRPQLLSRYHVERLKIIDRIGSRSLMKNGRIDTKISDHLPIIINLET